MIEILGRPPVRDPRLGERLAELGALVEGPDLVVAFPGLGVDAGAAWDRVIAADRPADDRPALVHLVGQLGEIREWAERLQGEHNLQPDPPIWPWGDGQVITPEGFMARERALAWWLEARVRRSSDAPWPRVLRPWPRHAWAVVHRSPLGLAERVAILTIVGETSFSP